MIKRAVDVVIAAALAVVATPVVAVFAVAIKVTSPGPMFHRTTRVGRDGVPFTLFKLRSMRTDRDPGAALTVGGDDRVTSVGRIIRKAKLDELPQLWNVIRGDMSLVGPRPEDPRYVEWYTPEQRRVLEWRPGITSPASVTFRDEEQVLAKLIAAGHWLEDAYRDVLTTKLSIELDYFPRATAIGDLCWMARTFAALFR